VIYLKSYKKIIAVPSNFHMSVIGRKNSKIFISEILGINMGSDNGSSREVYGDGTVYDGDGTCEAGNFLPIDGRTEGRVPGGIRRLSLTSNLDNGRDDSWGCGTGLAILASAAVSGGLIYWAYMAFSN
tara:strand:+ start:6595 stop:6978 length:384 start_codon:yes stop_codon:yes gene_type:complete